MIASALKLLCLAASFAFVAGPAEARSDGDARLRRCGSETCLVIEGRRGDPHAIVRIADHPVMPNGGRTFSVAIPLDTVRRWAAPFARSIAVGIAEPDGAASVRSVRLPIGLLGHPTELASLEISAR